MPNPLNRLTLLRQLPGRRAHGAYLAVIGVLTLNLVAVMAFYRIKTAQTAERVAAAEKRAQAAEKRLYLPAGIYWTEPRQQRSGRTASSSRLRPHEALARQQQIDKEAADMELTEARRLIAAIAKANEESDAPVDMNAQAVREMAQKQAQGYYAVIAREEAEKREAEAKGLPWDSNELGWAKQRFVCGPPYPFAYERRKDFDESARAYAEGLRHQSTAKQAR